MMGRNRGRPQGNEQHFGGKSRENIGDGNNKRKLFVGNFTSDVHEDDIRLAFENFRVEHVYMPPATGKKSFCFVVLDSIEAAQEAAKTLDGISVKGHALCIRPATERKEQGAASVGDSSDWSRGQGAENNSGPGSANKEGREIFVSSLPNDIEENDIVQLFDSFGLEKVVLKKSENKRPFAFVTLHNKESAASAIARLNDMHYRGNTLLVSLSRGKQAAPSSETSMNGPPMLVPNDHKSQSDAPVIEFYVGNLPDGCTEHDVRRTFSDFEVDYVQMKTKGDKTFGFLGLKWGESVEQAIPAIGRREVNGRNLVIRPSNPTSKGISQRNTPSNPPWKNETPSSLAPDSWDDAKLKEDECGGKKSCLSSVSCSDISHTEWSSMNGGPPSLELIEDDDAPVANGVCNHGGYSSKDGSENGDFCPSELFVDNLRRDVTETDVRNMFRKFGVSALNLKHLGKKSFAFVTLASEELAQDAINELNGKTGTDGRPITVRRKEHRPAPKGGGCPPGAFQRKNDAVTPSTPATDNMVHISNLPKEVGEEDILRLFEKYGVREVHLVSDGPHPYAFVALSSTEGQRKAVESLEGASMCGKKLSVCIPLEKCSQQRTVLLETPSQSPVVLCVANYPYSSREHHLMELLENFSPLEIIMIPAKQNGPANYTRCYVSVPSWEHAEDAVLELDDTYFYGRLLAVVPMAEGTASEIAAFDPSRRPQSRRKGPRHYQAPKRPGDHFDPTANGC